jgi:hypothetical protein
MTPDSSDLFSWPPDYVAIYAWRQAQILRIRADPALIDGAKSYYRTHPVDFIQHWMNTYDPRNAGGRNPAKMPFVLFPRQREMIRFLLAVLRAGEPGLIEKARDMGATWLSCAFSVWLWLYWDGASIGWGSRKEQLLDQSGDPDSLFEKMRLLIRDLPPEFLPHGFNPRRDMTAMKIINPENGASITGEAGSNIGRGGRKLIYFKDESAHYERPEQIEAALGDNTNVQIDISSVNGLGNVFHRRREAGREWQSGQNGGEAHAGVTNVFVMDWRDHPNKTEAWYNARRKKAEADGLLHVFAQEVERNYAASVEGVIIPAEWVHAAIDSHVKLDFEEEGAWVGALDVADGGMDKNAFAARQGPVLWALDCWAARDTGATARRAVALADDLTPSGNNIEINYDCIGVGAGVKAEANRLSEEGLLPPPLRFVPWDAGAGVLDPMRHVLKDANGANDKNSPLNKHFYANLKAQGWWELRGRFHRTHRALTEGITYPHDSLISLPSTLPHLKTLQKELSQPVATRSTRLKLLVEKTPPGTRSPNLADAVMMAYWPMPRRVSMWEVV